MSTAVKLGLGAAVLGLLFWLGKASTDVYQAVKGLTFRIVDFGVPKISNYVLSVPLRLEASNPTTTPLQADNVSISLFMLQKGTYIPVGGANVPNVVVTPGKSQRDFVANVDLRALTKNFLDTLDTIFATNTISLKADVLVTSNGVTLPPQTITKDIRV